MLLQPSWRVRGAAGAMACVALHLAVLSAAAQDEGFVNFNFDQVDVRTFVRLVGSMTGKKFVVSEGVDGVIPAVVCDRVSRQDIYPVFLSILESAGCSVVQDGDVSHVIKMDRPDMPLGQVLGPGEETPADGVFTKIIRVEHVSAAEIAKALASKVAGGKTGGVGAVEDTNHLIVTDTAGRIRRVEKIVAELDRPGMARITEVVSLRFAAAEDLAEQLNLAMAESESRGERLRQRLPSASGGVSEAGRPGAAVVASPRANSLILVGTPARVADLRRLIERMDVDAPLGQGRMNAILLKYISAEEAAKTLNALLGRSAGKEGSAAPAAQERRIAIEASTLNNALVVDASPADFEVVRKLVEQLDTLPQQVHIAVTIAEVNARDGQTLGVQMAALPMPGDVGDVVVQGASIPGESAKSIMDAIQGTMLPTGLSIGVAHGSRIDADGKVVADFPGLIQIDALRKQSRLKILSETALEAQDNREASVNIVNDIPVLKSTIQGGSGTARDVIQNIERLEVGIKLKLTPRIIPGGQVQMTLNPSIEAVIESQTAGSELTPTIARRDVSTTVTVPDGRTIVIAGLTREDTKTVSQKIPFLGSIPLVGWLFRHTEDVAEKSDLLILVTPYIVSGMEQADKVMQDWRDKTGLGPDDEP